MNLPAAGVLGVLASLLVGAGLLAPQAEAQSADVTLRAGWNNVVYAGERLPVEEALGAAAEAVDAVWHWEAASQGWESWFRAAPSLATLEELEPGEAYWLRADREVTWAQPARAEAEALLAVETASGAVRIVRVELADTAGERARGLMFRESLGADVGMLFLFAADTRGGFWMENTLVPLSIAFIDRDGVIIDIQDMEPLTRELHSPGAAYRWALEVNQGWFVDNGVEVGDRVRLTGA